MKRLVIAGLSVLLCPLLLRAEVVRIDVATREDVASGTSLGLAGPYEKLVGRIHYALDPGSPANFIITDIGKAPTNDRGLVEFSAEFHMLKPTDVTRGNGALLLEVGNRGGKGLLGFFNRAARHSDPTTIEDFGDGFLQREGFTLLWVGWQWDTPEAPGRMRMYPPIATDGGKPIRGVVRADFVPLEREADHSLADRSHIAHPVADPDAPQNVLTVRDDVEAARRLIPRSQWRFARLGLEGGTILEDPTRVYLEGGFEPRKIYEIVYVSENPPLVGAGPAGIRDMVSHLKYNSSDALSIPKGALNRAIGFGISQSGRLLRTWLYHGFNEDEAQRKVFDGILSHVAGGGRGSFNHRFAQASRDAHPYLNFFHPTDIFPFTDIEQTDPDTGIRDGILVHQKVPFQPKVFYTNSSYEYWGRSASLIHTTIDGGKDAPMMDNVRVYSFAGSQHGPTSFPPQKSLGQQRSNPMDFRWSMRALLLALDGWAARGTPPPPSQYGRVEGGTLVEPDNLRFPPIPGVDTRARIHKAYRADYGPRFRTDGIVTREPPGIGAAYPMRVPAVNVDGNEVAGIELPEHAVPLATYTGWNVFNAQSGPTHVLSSMQGSYIPFPRTEAERRATNDPRRSIEARYQSREEYLGLVAEAALKLVDGGTLLGRDVPAVLRQAGRHWDYLMNAESSGN